MDMAFGALAITIVVLGIAGFVLWIWALVDAIKTPEDELRAGTQLVWVLVILFASLVGAIIYLVVGRPRRGEGGTAATAGS